MNDDDETDEAVPASVSEDASVHPKQHPLEGASDEAESIFDLALALCEQESEQESFPPLDVFMPCFEHAFELWRSWHRASAIDALRMRLQLMMLITWTKEGGDNETK